MIALRIEAHDKMHSYSTEEDKHKASRCTLKAC